MAAVFGSDIDDYEHAEPAADAGDAAEEEEDEDEEGGFFTLHGQTQWGLRGHDDVPVKRLPRDSDRSARYHERTPEPNYSAFRAEYVDSKGREYSLARSGKHLAAQSDSVRNASFSGTPAREGTVKIGRLVLNLRMPINQRWGVPLPDPQGEKLRLYHPATQVLCEATTDGVFVASPRGRTGYVVVNRFASLGQVADPKPFEPWLRTGKPPGAERF